MVDTSAVGSSLPPAVITIERGPVSNFAKAIKDDNPAYQTPEAAREAGLENIPIPPTYPFAMANWGSFPEQQPEGHDKPNPMMGVFGGLMKNGGLILHGEQEFIYHGPVVVGDTLTMEGRIRDIYEKQSGEKTMTFIVSEQDYRNQHGELVLTQVTSILHRG